MLLSFGYAQAQAQAAQEAANHLQQYVATSNALAIPVSTAQATVVATTQQPKALVSLFMSFDDNDCIICLYFL